ncbi:MAG: N-acetylneuraminate synthase family protein [Patescibacteria group bacterium]|nr:N-acetylneuraminate synthase family protein [Patescibacteria group bacterium]
MENIIIKTPKGERIIGPGKPVFIIAEAGSNHDGKLEQAKKLIEIAADSGADAVKFQLFRAAKIYPPKIGKIPTIQGKLDLYEFLKQAELPFKWLPVLKKYSESRGLVFIVSPFDERAVDELAKVDLAVYKIASPELNHLPLLRYIARKGKPVIMSTGLSKMSEVEEAIETVRNEGNEKILLLHCVTGYPALPEEYNLRVMETLRKAFGVPVGLSDHSLKPALVPKIAAAAGASAVEKHFTINKKLPGADHSFSLEPEELKFMVKEIREAEKWNQARRQRFLQGKGFYQKILGSGQKIIAPSEKELYPGDKRSIFVIKNIKRGEKLTRKNTDILRAERYIIPGIYPKYYGLVLGKRVVKPIKKYTGLQWEYLLKK